MNRPTRIYLSMVSSDGGTVFDGFAALGQYSYDYLVGPRTLPPPIPPRWPTL